MSIDGIDISNYGCTLLFGSFDSLLKYPKRTAVPYNNWAESNGIQPDLHDFKLEPKKVSLVYSMLSGNIGDFKNRYNALYSALSAPGYRNFVFTSGIQRQLRLDGNSKFTIQNALNQFHNHSTFTLDFIDDFPAIPETYAPSGSAPHGLYSINGIDLGSYNIGGTENVDDAVRYFGLKEPWTDGQTIYTDSVKRKHKEIKLPLWMIAESESQFLSNYRSFFTQLSKTGLQTLVLPQFDETMQAYYTDCTAFAFTDWSPAFIGLKFNISLTVPY